MCPTLREIKHKFNKIKRQRASTKATVTDRRTILTRESWPDRGAEMAIALVTPVKFLPWRSGPWNQALQIICVPCTIQNRDNNKSLTTSNDLLYIGTLVAHHLLSHLEAARTELRRPHFLSAVTLPLAGSFFGYRLVAYNLFDRAILEKIINKK